MSDVGISHLTELYSKFDWFDSVGFDKYGRYVVYTKIINQDIMSLVIQKYNNKQVLLAFDHAKPGTKNKYINVINLSKEDSDNIFTDELDLNKLINSLNRLKKACKISILENIFYEIHDGKNALTNLSKRYPSVRRELEELFNVYGFDLIYEYCEFK